MGSIFWEDINPLMPLTWIFKTLPFYKSYTDYHFVFPLAPSQVTPLGNYIELPVEHIAGSLWVKGLQLPLDSRGHQTACLHP